MSLQTVEGKPFLTEVADLCPVKYKCLQWEWKQKVQPWSDHLERKLSQELQLMAASSPADGRVLPGCCLPGAVSAGLTMLSAARALTLARCTLNKLT